MHAWFYLVCMCRQLDYNNRLQGALLTSIPSGLIKNIKLQIDVHMTPFNEDWTTTNELALANICTYFHLMDF